MTERAERAHGAETPRVLWHPENGAVNEPDACTDAGHAPWESPPINFKHPDIADHQAQVDAQQAMIIDTMKPPHVSERRHTFVDTILWQREGNRGIKNYSGFLTRIHEPHTVSDPLMRDILHRIDIGKAHPVEVIDGVTAIEAASAVIGQLSHVYGYRLEYRGLMIDDVRSAIDSRGGEQLFDEPIEYEIIALDNLDLDAKQLGDSIAMKRKQLIGTIGGIDVYDRFSFVLCIDSPGFNQHVAHQMRSFYAMSMQYEPNGRDSWLQFISTYTELTSEVERLMGFYDLETLIPLSSTDYIHSPLWEQRAVNSQLRLSEPTTYLQPDEWARARAHYAAGNGPIPPFLPLTQDDITRMQYIKSLGDPD
jgi:hypothetical protein